MQSIEIYFDMTSIIMLFSKHSLLKNDLFFRININIVSNRIICVIVIVYIIVNNITICIRYKRLQTNIILLVLI